MPVLLRDAFRPNFKKGARGRCGDRDKRGGEQRGFY